MIGKNSDKKGCSFALGVSTGIAILATGTSTLTAAAPALEEIVVTAERRSQSLQDTAMSVTAFTGDMVSQGGITGMEDIAVQTPNLKMTNFNISEPQLYLRGIGNTNDSAGADPAIATFIDEVYIGRPSGTSTDLYDLERIEVLRGPQGTLYGRNAAGGAINIFTKKPKQEFEAKAGLAIGNENLVNVRAYINGPISDKVAGKLTFNVRERDGFAENVTTGQELEDDDTKSVRGQLLFSPSDTVEVLLGADYTEIDVAGSNRFLTNFDVGPQPPGIDAMMAANALFGNDPRKSSHNQIQRSTKEITGFLARVDVELEWATFTSITSYREDESSWNQPLVPVLSTQDGGLGLFEVNDSAVQDADQVSQEFRLSSETDTFKWVAGFFYFEENIDRSERFVTYWDPTTSRAVFSPGDVTFLQDVTAESIAIFGQFTWDITQAVALTVGARYNEDEKEVVNTAVSNIPPTPAGRNGIPLVGPPYSVNADETWYADTYRATLDWNITDDHMLYFTYSEGFKSGAFTGSTSSAAVAAAPIKPELATNYEVGARTEWLDGRVRFNITYFDLEYEDLQTFALVNFELVSDNASAEVTGVETDFALAITDNFSLTGSFATMDAEFTEGANAGNDLPRAPDTSWSITPKYSIPFDSGATLDLRVTASYTDEFHIELTNDPRGFEDDVTLIDASVKYTPPGEKWDATVWGKNLDDELSEVHSINGSFGGATKIYAPPRTYGVSFNYYWN